MYYIEEVRNGVICCKTTPHGEWKELSKELLTKRILRLQLEVDNLQYCLDTTEYYQG